MNLLLQITQMNLAGFGIRVAVIAVLAILAARYLSGVSVKDNSTALILAIALALLNATVGWALTKVGGVVNFVTFGLLSGVVALAINTFLVIIADRLIKGFEVKNLFWTILFALVLGIGNVLLGIF